MNILNFELLRNQKYFVHNCRFSQVWEKTKENGFEECEAKIERKEFVKLMMPKFHNQKKSEKQRHTNKESNRRMKGK